MKTLRYSVFQLPGAEANTRMFSAVQNKLQ